MTPTSQEGVAEASQACLRASQRGEPAAARARRLATIAGVSQIRGRSVRTVYARAGSMIPSKATTSARTTATLLLLVILNVFLIFKRSLRCLLLPHCLRMIGSNLLLLEGNEE